MSGHSKDMENPILADNMKDMLMIGYIGLGAEEVEIGGDVYILDAALATTDHSAKITLAIVKKFLVCVQEAYPVKLKEVHIINVSPLVDTIIFWVKPFLKEKFLEHIHAHSVLESLYNFVPKDILPEEYGGGTGLIRDIHEQWVQKLIEYGPWFKEQENIRADESKRPGKPTNYEDLFGLDGSFRQLTID